tara:strand:- start:541 stop:1566 length:1026 start_codon:yes stop_codon:yes gene_type:complete
MGEETQGTDRKSNELNLFRTPNLFPSLTPKNTTNTKRSLRLTSKTQTNMKHTHSKLIAACALLVSLGSSHAQDESPIIPVGSLSAFPTIVQTGTHPTLTWAVTVPEAVDKIIDIEGPGTIVPKRELIMDVRILGAGVTVSSSSSSQGFYFVPTQCQMSYNGGGYDEIFYGDNNDVNPNEIVHSQTVAEGSKIDFGARYYYKGNWGTWFSSTNSSGNAVALKNGDTPPTTTPMNHAPSIESFIRPYLDSDGHVKIGPRDVLYLMELTHTNPNDGGFDLQDMAILVSFYDATIEEPTPVDQSNNGHGNNDDGVDSSNPGSSKTGQDSDPNTDDERKKRGRRKK